MTSRTFLLLLFCASKTGLAGNGDPFWHFSFATRAWQSEAGLVLDDRNLFDSGNAVSPQVEFEARRGRLLLHSLFQFQTPYSTTRFSGDTPVADGDLKREDLELAVGWQAFGNASDEQTFHWFCHPLVGYKRLELLKDNTRSVTVSDDYRFDYSGPFIGVSQRVEWGRWALDLQAAYASFDVDAGQTPSDAPFRTYSFDADGFFLDLSLGYFLPRTNFSILLGYKIQEYHASPEMLAVEFFIENREPVLFDIAPPDFKADGIILGLYYRFSP